MRVTLRNAHPQPKTHRRGPGPIFWFRCLHSTGAESDYKVGISKQKESFTVFLHFWFLQYILLNQADARTELTVRSRLETLARMSWRIAQ